MKSKQEQLKSFKKANQAYKHTLATKAGFTSPEEYLRFLNGGAKRAVKIKEAVAQVYKPTIHIVDVLDASGSMRGGKYNNSCEGIRTGVYKLKDNKDVNYTYTLIEFVQSGKVITHYFLSELPNLVSFAGAWGNDTPLYNTVFNTLTRLSTAVSPESKVLVKVYTDGMDNAVTGFGIRTGDLIKKLEKSNFTVTFVATKEDMRKIIKDLRVDESNTLAVENSAEGFAHAFSESIGATVLYSAKVASGQSGEALTRGFYKKVGKL